MQSVKCIDFTLMCCHRLWDEIKMLQLLTLGGRLDRKLNLKKFKNIIFKYF
jgi:hypothetical protein